jgi:zinc protease
MVTYDYYGYPKDFIFQYQKGVQAVTKADVLRVAKEYLKPEIIATVAVGKPADFGKALTTLGAVKELDLSIPDPKQPAAQKPTARQSIAGKRFCRRRSRRSAGRTSWRL